MTKLTPKRIKEVVTVDLIKRELDFYLAEFLIGGPFNRLVLLSTTKLSTAIRQAVLKAVLGEEE